MTMSIRKRLRPDAMAIAIATISLTCVVACRTSTTNVSTGGRQSRTNAKDAVGQARSPGHLVQRSRHPAGAARQVRRPGVLHGRTTCRARSADCRHRQPGQRPKIDGRGERSETSIPNSPRHLTPCIFPSASGRRSSSIRRTERFLLSRRRPRRTGTPCDSSSSLCCSRRQPARRNTPAAPAANTDRCRRDETRRLRCT